MFRVWDVELGVQGFRVQGFGIKNGLEVIGFIEVIGVKEAIGVTGVR